MNKKLAAGYRVTYRGKLAMTDHRDRPTKKPEHLKLLDGFHETSSMIEYVFQSCIDNKKLNGGFLRCEYDSKEKSLFLITDFTFPEKPTKEQLAALKKECVGQWSDGMGESAFDRFVDTSGFSVDTYIPRPQVVQDRGAAFAATAKSKAINKKLLTAWKKIAKENQPKGDKALLEKCFKAINKGDFRQLKKLLELGNLDINMAMPTRSSAYHNDRLLRYATARGGLRIMELLLKEGADPNAPHEDASYAPLHCAKSEKQVKLLLEYGADPNGGACLTTPLTHWNILTKPKSVQALLDAGATAGSTELEAAAGCSGESVRILLDLGIKPTAQAVLNTMDWDVVGREPLGPKAQLTIVKQLIEAGVKPTSEMLCHAESIELMKFFIAKGAPVDKCVYYLGERSIGPLGWSISSPKAAKAARYLLDIGADPNVGKDLNRPICRAIQIGSLPMVKRLIKAGATLKPLKDGRSLVRLAKDKKQKAIADYLTKLECGVATKATKAVALKKSSKTKSSKTKSSKKKASSAAKKVAKKSAKKKAAKKKNATSKSSKKTTKGSRMFEYSDGKSNKFWEIAQSGKGFTVRYGRIGTSGQSKKKSFDSKKTSDAAAQKLIDQKTAKGYKEV